MEIRLQDLKVKQTSAAVLPFPDIEDHFVVKTSAPFFAIAAVLSQEKNDGRIHKG